MKNTYSIHFGGHRGLGCTDHDFYQDQRDISNLPVENTFDSIAQAFAQGADYIETDAVLSKDNIIFAIHNVVPKDHFFGADMPANLLNQMTFDDINRHQTGRHENGKLARMSDILNHIAEIDPKTLPWAINIEIKGVQGSEQNYENNDYLEILANTIEEANLPPERILWSSFSLENIIRMSHIFPTSSYGMLYAEKETPRGIYADHQDNIRYQYLPFTSNYVEMVEKEWNKDAHTEAVLGYAHPEIMTINPSMIDSMKHHDLGINCWALFEKLDDARNAYYQNILDCAQKAYVPFTVITDYLPQMKKLLAP